jgi:hypothetical protein
MLGLFASLVGIAFVSLELPIDAGALRAALPAVAAGMLLLWIGGILLGRSMGSFGRGRRR